jgi:hypothetical protein
LFHFSLSIYYRIGETGVNSQDYYFAVLVNPEIMKLEFVSCGPGRVFDPAARKGSFRKYILIILSKQLSAALQHMPSLMSKKDESVENKDYYLYVWNHFAEKFESKQKDLERTVCNELAEAVSLQSASRLTQPPPSILSPPVATTSLVVPVPPTSTEPTRPPPIPAMTISPEEPTESPSPSLLAGSKLNGFFSYSKEDWKHYLIYPPELEEMTNLQGVSRPIRPRASPLAGLANLQSENLELPNLNHPETTNIFHRLREGTQPIEWNRQTSLSPSGSSTKRKREEEETKTESFVHCPCREYMETLLESFESRLSKQFQDLLEKHARDLQEKFTQEFKV